MKFLHSAFAISLTFTVFVFSLHAAPRSPLPPFPERTLNTWRFDNPLSWGGPLSPPLALSGTRVEEAGSGYALRVGGALGPVLNRFPLFQSDGRPNLTLRSGTVRLWFAPDWSSGSTGGKGPGSFARLIEVGEVSEKAAGWWSLYFDPAGDAIHFSAQADGVSADYLKAPIAWQAGEWHQVTLIYAEKFSALYLDGELATVGEGVSVAPEEQAVAASGFVLGGDGWGASLAEGQFDELTTLDHPAGGMEILANYKWLGPVLQLGPVTSAETEFNRARSAAAKASKELQAGPSEEGGAMRMMAMLSSPCGTNLCLGIEVVDQYAVLTLFNTLPGTNYQIFSRADLYDHSLTNSALNSAVLEQELVGVEDQNYTQTVIPMSGRPWLFFRARETDRDIPHLHISDVRPPVLPEPYVQVRGYSENALASLTWTVTNSTGTTNGRGYILQQHYDTQQYKLTTNWWQCFDVPLGPGFNRIVITAADREGHTNSTTLHYASIFVPGRAPPAAEVIYPPAGVQVSGTNFTLRGTLDNPTATVLAQVVTGGVTNRMPGLVERTGNFWIENLPLTAGTNSITLIATDVGGTASTNALAIVGSAVPFVVTGIGGDGDLYKPVAIVGAELGAADYTVSVNGVSAANISGGTWVAEGVPIDRAGVAVFRAEATGGGPTLVTELMIEKPTRAFFSAVDREQIHAHDWTPCDFGSNSSTVSVHSTNRLHWGHYGGGLGTVFTHSAPRCTDGQVESSDRLCTEFWDGLGGYTNSGGPCPSTTMPPPYAEHAGVAAVVTVGTTNGNRDGHYLLRSESQMHVQSGGRSIAHRSAVVRFDGSGLEYFVGQDPGNTNPVVPGLWSWEFTAVGPYVTDITTNVTVLDGKLGPDGRLYSAIPAGAEIDCTPFAPGDYHRITLTAADATPRLYNDADNDNTIAAPNSRAPDAWLKDAPPGAHNPGKILFVNNGDADRDGVPNFADGYGLFGTNESPDSGGLFTPLEIHLPPALNLTNAQIRFIYSGSAPYLATAQTNGEDVTYSPAPGQLRLWTANGNVLRSGNPLGAFGNYVDPGTAYRALDLGLMENPPQPAKATLYVEALLPSQSAGDAVITLELDPDGADGPAGFIGMDTVRFTVLGVSLVEVSDESTTQDTGTFKSSSPSPTITISQCQFSNVGPSADGTRLLANLTVEGTVASATCDITPGTNGIITGALIWLNGVPAGEADGGVALQFTKGTNITSLTRPYPFTGAFSTTFFDVEVDVGINVIRVMADDPLFPTTGYTEAAIEVGETELYPDLNTTPILLSDLRATLDFGSNVHSLAELTGTNAVRLFFDNLPLNLSSTNTLHLVTNSLTNGLVLLYSPQAWVILPDTNQLDYHLRGDVRGAALKAIISVPALAPRNTFFLLDETGEATSAFSHDHLALALGFTNTLGDSVADTITARLARIGDAWVTNALTETGTNTLVFETGDQTFRVTLGSAPVFDSTNYEHLVVTVTSSNLNVFEYQLDVFETDTNSLKLTTYDELDFTEDEEGEFFGYSYSASSFSVAAASDGGEMHLHLLKLLGPPEVLETMRSVPNAGIVRGPDGCFYYADSLGLPANILGIPSYPGLDLTNSCSGSVAQAFLEGFGGGAVDLVKGTKMLVWDLPYLLGGQIANRTTIPIAEDAVDLYYLTKAQITGDEQLRQTVMEGRAQQFKEEHPYLNKLRDYLLNQLSNPSGDIDKIAGGFFEIGHGAASGVYTNLSADFKKLEDNLQKTVVAAARALALTYSNLNSGCPQVKARILGRATFELATIYFSLGKSGEAVQATRLAKPGEAANAARGGLQASTVTEELLVSKIPTQAAVYAKTEAAAFKAAVDGVAASQPARTGLTFKNGRSAEQLLHNEVGGSLGGPGLNRIETSQGARFIDVISGTTAYESKVGFVQWSSRVEKQILKDAEILAKTAEGITRYEWRFYRSATTGKIGADPRVLDLLKQKGIGFKICH